jgi:hypothetical protein
MPLLDPALSTPRLVVELAEPFTVNVVAKIWRVAVRELEKEVSPLPYQTKIEYTNTKQESLQPTAQPSKLTS